MNDASTTDRSGTATPRTILVLDDDAGIRRAARRILEAHGYRVLEAEAAHEALDVMQSTAVRVDLLLCDLVLPGLGGREAANALIAHHPDLKVLFISGYTTHGSGRRQIQEAGMPFLAKPFEISELIEAVEAALDG